MQSQNNSIYLKMILLSCFSLLVICFLPYLISNFQIYKTHPVVNKDAYPTFSRDQHDTVFAKRRMTYEFPTVGKQVGKTIPRANQKRSVFR